MKCYKGKTTCNMEGFPECYSGTLCRKESFKRISPTRENPKRKDKRINLYKETLSLDTKNLERKLLG